MFSLRSDILKSLDKNRVLLLRGDTGSGKTTQVPQFILEHFTEKMNGASCNIIVTQPRRISAISVAERIASERDEPIGQSVGFRVRLKQRLPKGNGAILFTTPGMLLRSHFENDNFEGVSHIIVDEIHERDIWTDFLLILLKRALKSNENLKLILMSATFSIDKFQQYFPNSTLVECDGRKYDVEEHFLENVCSLLQRPMPQLKTFSGESDIGKMPTDVKLLADTLLHIHKTENPGAILCFLPTVADIKATRNAFLEIHPYDDVIVLPCHSRLPIEEQEKVFHIPSDGIRKIILSTNIAETSITINDVRYVVNTGTQKSHVLDKESQSMRVVEAFSCKAAQIQRKGRAGRVAEGICYHMFSKNIWDGLEENFVPQLLRAELSTVVLLAKVFSPNEDPAEFLSDAADPPNDYQIEYAVNELCAMNFLDKNRNLTPLGKRLAQFGCTPALAKALLYGAVFKCIDPVLSIVSMCDLNQNFFSQLSQIMDKSELFEVKRLLIGNTFSDDMVYANLFNRFRNEWKNDDKQTLDKNVFNTKTLQTASDLRRLFENSLVNAGLCSKDTCFNIENDINRFKDDENLIKAALTAGLNQNLLKLNFPFGDFNKRKGVIYFSDNFNRRVYNFRKSMVCEFLDQSEPPPSFWFSCMHKVLDSDGKSFAVDSLSMVHPLHAILFSGLTVTKPAVKDVNLSLQPSANFDFSCQFKSDASDVIELRNVIEQFVEWICLDVPKRILECDNERTKFNEFHNDLLHVLRLLFIE